MAVDVAQVSLVVVFEDLFKRRNVLARCLVGYDVTFKVYLFNAFELELVGDYAPDTTVFYDVFNLFGLQQFGERDQYAVG